MALNLKGIAAAAAVAGALALGGATSAQALNVGTLGTPVGSGTMTATANAGASRLVVNGSIPLNCSSATATATIITGVYALPATIGVVQPAFTGCVGPSGFTFTVACNESASLVVTGGGPSTWSGYLDTIQCTVTFNALACSATITGRVNGSYTNPVASPATAGRLTVFAAGQTLAVSNSTCPTQVLPNGTGQFGAPGTGSLGVNDLTYVLNGAATTHPFLS